VRQETCEHELI